MMAKRYLKVNSSQPQPRPYDLGQKWRVCTRVQMAHKQMLLREYTQNFCNKHVKLDAVFVLSTKKEGSRRDGALSTVLTSLLFLTVTQFRDTLQEGFIFVYIFNVSVRHGGKGQQSRAEITQCPGSRALSSLFSPFLPLSQQCHRPLNGRRGGFPYKLVLSGNIYRGILRCGLCLSPKYFKSMQDDIKDQ